MTISNGVFKQCRIKRQTGKGTLAGTTGGQVLRRKTSKFELQKETYDTNDEINSAQQMQSFTHGPKKIDAAISGLLSPGTYSDPLAAVLRRDFAVVTAITGASVTIAASGSFFTLTDAANTFLTKGVKIGMVIRLTAGAFNANNLNKNILVTTVTQTVITGKVLNNLSLTPEGPIATATITLPGKVTFVPSTGHTDVYYTAEEWYSDVAQSERNQDVQFGQASITLPGTGNATIDFTGVGLDQTQATAAYFSAPTAETTTDVVQAANGALLVNGVVQASLTSLQFAINGQIKEMDGVVGTNLRPDIEAGKVMVSGSFTAYFEDYVTPTLFTAETEFSILQAATAGSAAGADFVAFAMPRVKLASSSPEDGEKGQKRTYNFTAIYNINGGSGVQSEKTTVQVHDSQAA